MATHQKRTGQQYPGLLRHEAVCGQQHDGDFQIFDQTHQPGFVPTVGNLSAGGGKQYIGQDKQSAYDQTGQRRRQPSHLQLVGDHHRKGELEYIVIARAAELRPEEGAKTALPEQCKLIGLGLSVHRNLQRLVYKSTH